MLCISNLNFLRITSAKTRTLLLIIAMFLVTSPIVINMPTRELLAVETKSHFEWQNKFDVMFVNSGEHSYCVKIHLILLVKIIAFLYKFEIHCENKTLRPGMLIWSWTSWNFDRFAVSVTREVIGEYCTDLSSDTSSRVFN